MCFGECEVLQAHTFSFEDDFQRQVLFENEKISGG